MNNDELYHYGILGMRWGKRRATTTPNVVSTQTKKESQTQSTSNNSQYIKINTANIKKGLAIAGATVLAMGTMSAMMKGRKASIERGKKLAQQALENKKSAKISDKFWKSMRNVKKAPSLSSRKFQREFADLLN